MYSSPSGSGRCVQRIGVKFTCRFTTLPYQPFCAIGSSLTVIPAACSCSCTSWLIFW